MKIGIIGMGYVGIVGAVCLASKGHNVIGMDVDKSKITNLKNGQLHIYETDLENYFQDTIKSGNLNFTDDLYELVENTEICFICVGTPSDKDGNINLTYIESVSKSLGYALKNKKDFYVICCRSTIACGTSKNIIIPLIENISGKKSGVDFGYAFNPEFLREGTAIYDFFNPPKTVIGHTDEKTKHLLLNIYRDIPGEKITLPILESEMIKYADNVWHAIKVVFANEIGLVAKSYGGDGRIVMDVFCKDKKLNLSPYYLKPGFAFGGSCLPKDIKGFINVAKNKNKKIPMIESLQGANNNNINYAYELIVSNIDRLQKIVIIGVAFKKGTDDTRESPAVYLAKKLIDNGYKVKFYDPIAGYENIILHFGENFLKIKSNDFYENLEDAMKDCQNIVLTGNFDDMPSDTNYYQNKKIFDLNGVFYDNFKIRNECDYYAIAW